MELWGPKKEFAFSEIKFLDDRNEPIEPNRYKFLTKNRIFDNTRETFDINLKLGNPVFFSLRRTNKNIISVQFEETCYLSSILFKPVDSKGKESLKQPK